jgi:hypothetical protein
MKKYSKPAKTHHGMGGSGETVIPPLNKPKKKSSISAEQITADLLRRKR